MSFRRIVWPDYAILDLDEIHTTLVASSVKAANATVKRIIEATRQLREHPYSGRIVASFPRAHVRQIFVDDYRVVYELIDDVVEIWMVLHTRRQFPPKKILDRKTFT